MKSMHGKHEGGHRGFYILSESWYAEAAKEAGVSERLTVGIYHECGGTTGEFSIRWIEVCGKFVPRLEAFSDAWDALAHFRDLLTWMASVDSQRVTPQQFTEQLRSLGFKDMTSRKPKA